MGMKSEPHAAWRRWADAEREGFDDQADAAFRDLVHVMPARPLRAEFGDCVMQAVEREIARQARVARALQLAIGLIAAVLAVVVVLQLPRLLSAVLNGGVAALLWTMDALNRGLDAWAILAQIGRIVAAVLDTPEVMFAVVAFGLVALAALYALQRMLEFEERSSL
jgi:hypothetical protein